MSSRATVVLDVHRGEARLGDKAVELRSAGDGCLQVGGAAGPVLRPVTWGERAHAVALALGSSQREECLAAEVARAAAEPGPPADSSVAEIVALHLAGAGEPAPPFSEASVLVARATGWGPAELAAAEAAEVDRLASALALRADDEQGWQVLLLGDRPSLEELRDELAGQLLARAEPSIVEDPRPRVGDVSLGEPAPRWAAAPTGLRESSVGAAGAPAAERPSAAAEAGEAAAGQLASQRAGHDRPGAVAAAAGVDEASLPPVVAGGDSVGGGGPWPGVPPRHSVGAAAGTVTGLRATPAANAHASPAVALFEPRGTARDGSRLGAPGPLARARAPFVEWQASEEPAPPSPGTAARTQSRAPAAIGAAGVAGAASAFAEAVAGLLHDEADLRGVRR